MLCCRIIPRFVDTFHLLLISDKNNGHIERRPVSVSARSSDINRSIFMVAKMILKQVVEKQEARRLSLIQLSHKSSRF